MRFLPDTMSRLARRRPPKMVRPWALSAPILVLMIALPLLRPLRHPGPAQMSDDERARLATVQGIVERGSLQAADALSLDGARVPVGPGRVRVNGRAYSNQPPMMAALLSGAYWVMHRNGLTLRDDGSKVIYLLTVLGVTIPAAGAAGLVYRMGRLFELPRSRRAGLAAAAVGGTGLLSYATVLNPHVPAAALVLAAAACLVHLAISPHRIIGPFWVGVAGFCAALAATIDPTAAPFLVLLPAVVVAIRWRPWVRVGGVAAYFVGAALPVLAHTALTVPVTGDFLQGVSFKPQGWAFVGPPAALPDEPDEDDVNPALGWRVAGALFGAHGIFSHFPVLLLGAAGVGMVMHRHWPSAAKVLAAATAAGSLLLVVVCAAGRHAWADWRDAMFASRWFIVFGPLLLFWAGAWARRPHRAVAWLAAGVLLAFSAGVSVVGAAAGPLPRGGYDRYTAAAAWDRLVASPGKADDRAVVVVP